MTAPRRVLPGIRRPTHTFPEQASLQLTPPPGFASAEVFRDQLTAALAEREAQAGRDTRGPFLGVARVLGQKATGRPAPWEPRRTLNPRVAARDK